MQKLLRVLPRCGQIINKTPEWNCTQLRFHSIGNEAQNTSFGKDGHYDIIILGGGGAGISLAGAICKRYDLNFDDSNCLVIDF